MAKVRTEHKEKLLVMGKWGEFVVRRDELKAQGVKAGEANRIAVLEFLGEEAAKSAGEGRDRNPTIRKSMRKVGGAGAVDTAAQDTTPVVVTPSAQNAAPAPPSPPAVPLDEFGGSEASGEEIIMWVIRHLDVATVTPADCPDPAAWSYLQQCRSSALFRQNFMLQVGLRSLLKKEGDGSGDDVISVRLDETIDKLLQLRGTVSATERPHSPFQAGSTPAPATTIEGGA